MVPPWSEVWQEPRWRWSVAHAATGRQGEATPGSRQGPCVHFFLASPEGVW
jgi:hypothetical protein